MGTNVGVGVFLACVVDLVVATVGVLDMLVIAMVVLVVLVVFVPLITGQDVEFCQLAFIEIKS